MCGGGRSNRTEHSRDERAQENLQSIASDEHTLSVIYTKFSKSDVVITSCCLPACVKQLAHLGRLPYAKGSSALGQLLQKLLARQGVRSVYITVSSRARRKMYVRRTIKFPYDDTVLGYVSFIALVITIIKSNVRADTSPLALKQQRAIPQRSKCGSTVRLFL